MRLHSKLGLTLFATLIMTTMAVDADAQNRLRNMFGASRQRQQVRNPRNNQQNAFNARLNQFIQTNRLKAFTKHGKKVIGVKQNVDMKPYLNLGKNVVEFFVKPGFHHLYARVPYPGRNGKMEHKVFSRISGLDKSNWYKSTSERVSVLVELSDNEMTNLRKFLDKAHQNPREVLGPFNYNGGRPPHASNCTSYITNAKIGQNGETLARVLGVYESGMPQSFLNSMLTRGNDKVKAMVVQNPSSSFDQNFDIAHALR